MFFYMKIKKISLLALSVIAIILEALPYGVVLLWANPDGEPWKSTYSYFDLLPFGYALFGPFITAILTCILTVLCAVFLFSRTNKLEKSIFSIACAAGAISLTPLLLGIEYFSVIGVFISVALIAIAVIIKSDKKT